MQYALLIYGSEADAAKMTPADGQAMFQGYMEFTKWLQSSGKAKGGEPLEKNILGHAAFARAIRQQRLRRTGVRSSTPRFAPVVELRR